MWVRGVEEIERGVTCGRQPVWCLSVYGLGTDLCYVCVYALSGRQGVQVLGEGHWEVISTDFLQGQRSAVQCSHRWQKVRGGREGREG
jgi:hypothetical protein